MMPVVVGMLNVMPFPISGRETLFLLVSLDEHGGIAPTPAARL